MQHRTNRRFWTAYRALPIEVRLIAKKSYRMMERDPRHPSVRLKKVREYWSARIGPDHRALAIEVDDGLLWIWIGTHAAYDKLLR